MLSTQTQLLAACDILCALHKNTLTSCLWIHRRKRARLQDGPQQPALVQPGRAGKAGGGRKRQRHPRQLGSVTTRWGSQLGQETLQFLPRYFHLSLNDCCEQLESRAWPCVQGGSGERYSPSGVQPDSVLPHRAGGRLRDLFSCK